MANPFQAAGADKLKPSPYAPIFTNEFFTGLWTQRSPLRDAATPYLYQKFYSASRYDSLLSGSNVEVTNRLTIARRPGHSTYNSSTTRTYNRLYEFRIPQANSQLIRVMGDNSVSVDDVTPNFIGGTGLNVLFTKSSGALKTQFQSVGSTLYFGNGIDLRKWIYAAAWQASTLYQPGALITDPNGNLQMMQGAAFPISSSSSAISITNNLLYVKLASGSGYSPSVCRGKFFTFSGLTTATFLNGQQLFCTGYRSAGGGNPTMLIFSFTHANYAPAADTGILTPAGQGIAGTSGGSAPSWSATFGASTQDSQLTWVNKGSMVQAWGIAAPAVAPSASSVRGASYPVWAASTFYWGSLVILDPNNNVQLLTTAGTTAATRPTFNGSGTTTDGSAVWTYQGPGGWQANHAYTAGAYVVVTYSVQVVSGAIYNPQTGQVTLQYSTVTYTDLFMAQIAGTSGSATPNWWPSQGSITSDGSIQWANLGTAVTRSNATSIQNVLGNSAVVTLNSFIVDANGNQETPVQGGLSGASVPTWPTASGSDTTDNQIVWNNAGSMNGAAAAGNTAPWLYGFAFRNSALNITGPMSPLTGPIVPTAGNLVSLTGQGDPNSPLDGVDTIRLFRTPQGGSIPEFLADLPWTSGTWSYIDSTPDTALNALILGDTTGAMAPPPAGFLPDTYHLGRIFGHVGNVIYYSNGPAALNGTGGNDSFSPSNNFVMPAPVIRQVANALGLFVFTTAGMYTIPGSGTVSDPLQEPVPFLEGKVAGLLSYDALAVNGTLLYLMNSKSKILMLDPSSGVSEIGFPIGDQFLVTSGATFSPQSTFITWHDGNSTDAALYVANGNASWFRCNPTPAPETGLCWSPRADVTGGAALVQSVEVSPGVNKLIVQAPNGPLLFRDPTNWNDGANGSFAASFTIGSSVLAHPGSVALMDFIATDCIATGSRVTPAVLLDEISGSFETLSGNVPDPSCLAASVSTYNDRWYLSETQQPALCRHLQIQFSWPSENYGNEMLAYTIFGAIVPEL